MDRVEIRTETVTRADWDGRLSGHAAALQQHWAYGRIAQGQGARVERLSLWQGGTLIGVAQLLRRRGLTVLLRGPVWLADVSAEARRAGLRALARRRLCLLATPEQAITGCGVVPLITPRHHAVLDLRADLPVLRAAMAGKWRNRLARAEASGLRPTDLHRPAEWRWLIEAEASLRAQRRYRALPAGFVSAWDEAEPGGVLACQIARRGVPLAGMLFLRHGTGASYHLGWSGPEGRAASAHNLLLWHAVQGLKAAGVGWLDLGDVNDETAAGLAHFKLGCGAEAKPLGATCLVLPS